MPDTVLAFSVANKYGGLPPPGCRFPTNLGHPRVAVGDEVQGPYEATFSIQPGNLMECLFNVVEQSWTLKAWFAYKIKVRGLKDTCDLEPRFPTWERVWEMIQQKRSTWEERYKTRKNEGTLTTQWELCEPKSTLELLACAVVVLACQIPANFDNEQQNACPLKWYPYYYEHNGRIFTLYRFMAYQNKLFAPYRTNTIHFESDRTALGMECWLQSWGYRIHQASEDFVNDTHWDPLDMLGEQLKGKATRKRKTVIFVQYKDRKQRQVIRKSTQAIRRSAEPNLGRTLKKLLGLGEVSIKSHQNAKSTQTIEEFWDYIDSRTYPIFWVSPSAESHNTKNSTISERASPRDYGNHATLKLEHMVDQLDSPEQARSAQLRFALIRENHRHSADFVKELKQYFASLDQATTAQWQRLSDCRRMCEDAKLDMTQFYKLRKLTDALNDAQQTHAQQYFGLINTNSPLADSAAEHLIKLLMPDEVEWEEVSRRKNIFDEVKEDASQ